MIRANFCLNCMAFGCYEEEITIYEYSAFKGRKYFDKVDGGVYCLSCEDGGHIILSEIDEDVFEKIKGLYGDLPIENNPASAFILLLAIADYPKESRVRLYPIRYIPEGLFDEKMRREIEEGKPEVIIEAWVRILEDRISKNPEIAKAIERAIEDLSRVYPDENVRKVCEKMRNMLTKVVKR